MLQAYQLLLDKARRDAKIYRKRLQKLAQLTYKKSDAYMQEVHALAFEEIDCLQCANCCKGTGPLLKSTDIDQLAKNKRMKAGAFMDTWLKTDEDGDFVFKQLPCPFLDSDLHCSVYESRPEACREFPHSLQRHFSAFKPLHERNLLICPALVRMMDLLVEHYPSDFK